ncbi:related to phosphatidylglycerol/phosphatidylinositol transfer protein [Melanopsichium pennsylvanicum]|uniref:Phosphatidylglycerol/phosphatidylinositol transfer protein n=2 Tax=Melanopsichium pennsylvanicum TaxID=63383 RepID=A0AAJ4XR37_9BASI|nr:related to phosphatidylglycerol/phosphatidylinositol transfer protein [Melanopsichium pennsylvanicum 4]SNX87684.1 related to phosphatidylglycerol/phosphatidylinositol transfer protein [Melanopsichium pennsylvanicum]
MRAPFVAATLASLAFASQALAWGCIGQDCNHVSKQISFSAPQQARYNDKTKLSALDPVPGQGWQWASCGTGDEVVDVDSIVVSPDPPVPGQNLTVRAKGTIKDEVSDGTFADVVVKLGLIRLLARRFDVCEQARANDADLQCPLSPGEYELVHTVALPREIPPGKFNVHVSGENQDGSSLLCLDLSILFGFRR